MSCSTRSTERARLRRGGFTLMEIMIAVGIFAIVISVALSQLSESTDATRVVTAQADLRRIGENVMNEIVRDLRSTLAPFTSVATTGDSIEFWRVTDLNFDKSGEGKGCPPLNGPSAYTWTLAPGAAGAVVGMPAPYPNIETSPSDQKKPTISETIIHRYRQNGTNLEHQYGATLLASPQTIVMASELAPANDTQPGVGTVSGFTITASQALPGLMTANGNNRFLDKPTTVTIKLVLKRTIGIHKTTFDKQYAWVTIANQIQLRPTRKY